MDKRRLKAEWAATIGDWLYVSCHTIVKFPGGTGATRKGQSCEACCNTNLRFIHTLEHLDDGRQLTVGIECARILLGGDEWEVPGLAENEVRRKERWRIHYRRPGRCSADIQDLMNRGKL